MSFSKIIEEELRAHQAIVDLLIKKALATHNIGVTTELLESIRSEVFGSSSSDQGRYKLIFKEYGRMVDMGAGRRAKKIQTTASNGELIKQRSPKKWYSKTVYRQLSPLHSKLRRRYQEHVAEVVKNSLIKPV